MSTKTISNSEKKNLKIDSGIHKELKTRAAIEDKEIAELAEDIMSAYFQTRPLKLSIKRENYNGT